MAATSTMSKEHKGVHIEERIIRAERRQQEERHGYRTMRRGKTARDHKSGAWGNRFDNRELDPNRKSHK